MRNIFLILCMLLFVGYGKETKVPKDKTESESDKKSDGSYAISNQCCSTESPECCVSLTYVSSSSKEEDVPEEFGGIYYCETMDLSVSDECGNLDYIVLPLSKSCDLTRTIYDLKGGKDFKKCERNENGGVMINNAAEYLLSPDDEENPTGLSALKFPLDDSSDDQQITICTQFGWGQIVNKLDDKEIEIGFSIDNTDRFKCQNDTIRDICSIDTSLATYKAEQKVPKMIENLGGMKSVNNADDPRVDNFIDTFEYYWNQWVGFGIAVFAASIFFNMVMCIYWSGLIPRENGKSIMDKKMKVMIDGDDDTEEESDDTDESTSDQEDQHI